MKVRELIEILNSMDGDLDVEIEHHQFNTPICEYYPVRVELTRHYGANANEFVFVTYDLQSDK